MLQTNSVYLTMQYRQPVTNAFTFSVINNMNHLPEHWKHPVFYPTVCSRVSYDAMNKQGLARLSPTGLCHAEAVFFVR
jgi:hypothetical protein